MDNLSFIPDDYEEIMESKDQRSIEIVYAIALLDKHGYFTAPVLLWHKEDICRWARKDLTKDQIDAIIPIINEQLDSHTGEYICEFMNDFMRQVLYEHCFHIIHP